MWWKSLAYGEAEIFTLDFAALLLFMSKVLSDLQLGEVGRELIRAGDVSSIKDAYHVLQGMAALTGSGKLPLPVRLQLTSATVRLKEVSA